MLNDPLNTVVTTCISLSCVYRAMEFIQVFISEVAGGEHSLDIAAGKAYTKSLRKYHNWIVRGIFSVRSVIHSSRDHIQCI